MLRRMGLASCRHRLPHPKRLLLQQHLQQSPLLKMPSPGTLHLHHK